MQNDIEQLREYYQKNIKPLVLSAPYVLRVTRDMEGMLRLVAKERLVWMPDRENQMAANDFLPAQYGERLVDRGVLTEKEALKLLPLLKTIVSKMTDPNGLPLKLGYFLSDRAVKEKWSLPLDEFLGSKVCLILRLVQNMNDEDRMLLIAHRVDALSREEVSYWLTWTTSMGRLYNRWAIKGMRIILAGPEENPHAKTELLKYLRPERE